MAIRNVTRGGGKPYKEAVTGIKDLERKLKALMPDNPPLKADLYRIVGKAAAEVRQNMRARAIAAGWAAQKIRVGSKKHYRVITGQMAIDSIFSFDRPNSDNPRKRISALAGVSKPKTMVEWSAGRPPNDLRGELALRRLAGGGELSGERRVSPGNPVAMGFATMLEFGTSRMKHRPAIRVAVADSKPMIIDTITDGYSEMLKKYSQ